MGDLQVDLNAALVAVKQKCVDLDEKIKREDERHRGRGYLGVKRYIYALTTQNTENSLHRRGRSLTRVYVEQKFYRSKSVPSPDQVQRLEDCTQDYGPNGEERLEYIETTDSPLEELIKEDHSHRQVVSQRLPQNHAEWDHEMAVFEEDGDSGLLEDRTLTVRCGDHPYGMNQFGEQADEISARIAKFFGQKNSSSRSRELSLSVQPSYATLPRSKSVGSVAARIQNRPPVIDQTTTSLSDLYHVETRHNYDSKYGSYVSGLGRYGTLPPPANPEVLPKRPKFENVYDVPKINSTPAILEEYRASYERKYDFKSKFPPNVDLPEGYHDYYDPSKFCFLDSQGYYQGNITRPLHYSYSRDYLEKYSDYQGTSRQESPLPPVEPEPEKPIIVLQKVEELPQVQVPLRRDPVPDYYDPSTRHVLRRTEDVPTLPVENVIEYPEYRPYETQEIVEDFGVEEPVYEEVYEPVLDVLHYSHDLEQVEFVREVFVVEEPHYEEPQYEEPVYEEVYEPVLDILKYTHDVAYIEYTPAVPFNPPPPPPPQIVDDHIHVAKPIVVEIPELPDDNRIYVGQDALDMSVSPTFGQTTDHKNNLGLEKSVLDRVREMEEEARKGDEVARRRDEERRHEYERRREEIREGQRQTVEFEEEVDSKNTPAPIPQPIVVPSVFVPEPAPPPEKPKRTWVPPPKFEEHFDEKEDKPLGPVIFHELIYQQGIIRRKYHEDHNPHSARPVSRPVSRANSRPNTPGLEIRSIDFPRLDEPRDHSDSTANVDYVHQRIERYNAIGASNENSHAHREKSVVHVNSTAVREHHVVYDEPSREMVYDIPHDEHDMHLHEKHHDHHEHHVEHHHNHHQNHEHHHDHHVEVHRDHGVHEDAHHHHHHHQHDHVHSHSTSESHHHQSTILQMSKSNKWDESSHHHHSVLQQSNSLNRQNIPPPLHIENGNFTSHENSENMSSSRSKSTTDLGFPSVNVGHVKQLAQIFTKHDEKPISTEQVIYRIRDAPPGHHFEHEIRPRPRSLPRVPMDEVELHGAHHQSHLQHNQRHSTPTHNSNFHYQTEEPTVRVRRVYKALEDTSMLSPVSLTSDDVTYDVPN